MEKSNVTNRNNDNHIYMTKGLNFSNSSYFFTIFIKCLLKKTTLTLYLDEKGKFLIF